MSGTLQYADERSEANEAGADAVKPAPRVLNHPLHMEGFFNGLLDGREITTVSSG